MTNGLLQNNILKIILNPLQTKEYKHMAQQTAVEWLFSQIPFEWSSSVAAFESLQQAKEMEKEQHDNTWIESRIEYQGDDYIGKEKTFEQYYNETYKTQNT
jgi:hypothetical protein